jgi:hypothetical protein
MPTSGTALLTVGGQGSLDFIGQRPWRTWLEEQARESGGARTLQEISPRHACSGDERDAGGGRIGAEEPGGLESAEPRQVEVEHDNIRNTRARSADGHWAVRGLNHVVAFGAQVLRPQLEGVHVVVNNQDAGPIAGKGECAHDGLSGEAKTT